MANAFARAEKKAKAPGKTIKPPETVWTLGIDDPLQANLTAFLGSVLSAKSATAVADGAKSALVEECTARWFAHLADYGARPGSTMRLVGKDGSVTFVVKEERLPCDDDALAELVAIVGAKAEELVSEEVSIKFDGAILSLPTARAAAAGEAGPTLYDWLGDKLGGILARGVKSGEITQEQADGLIVAEKRRVITAGYIDAIASACKGDRGRIESGLRAIGGVKRHVQA